MRLTLGRQIGICASHSTTWLLTSMVLFWSNMASCEVLDFYHALVKYSFTEGEGGDIHHGVTMNGTYGLGNRPETETGRLIHVRSSDGTNNGCQIPVNVPKDIKWVALIQRGGCKFNEKINNTAIRHSASAVVIYNHRKEDYMITMQHSFMDEVISVFLRKEDGEHLAKLTDSGYNVKINISVGKVYTYNTSAVEAPPSARKSKVMLLTSMCFIVLLIIGLIVLLVYAVRRSKYIQDKNRTSMVFTLQETAQAQERDLLTEESADPQEV